jgi:MtaA/CmuA family methyltransferase
MDSRERFMRTLEGREADRVPVFPMLMAFSAVRAGLTYREFASEGRLLAEAQVAMQERFSLDCITVCSDAFRLSGALGGELVFPDAKPPYLRQPLLRGPADAKSLGRPDPTDRGNRLGDRVRAVEHMAALARKRYAVCGWIDMPFAECCSLCGVEQVMYMAMDDPAGTGVLLQKLTALCIDFALAQVDAGADIIGAGDAAASLLSPAMYRDMVLPFEREVVRAVHARGSRVKLHICGSTADKLEDMVLCEADLFNVDHMVPLDRALEVYGRAGRSLKGNLDPVADVLQASPEECAAKARRCIQTSRSSKASGRYMLSAGCEIPAETPDETFRAFCAVQGSREGSLAVPG